MNVSWVLFIVGAYLAGSIPFGAFIARIVARIDITQHGSGNIGATNVARSVGLKWGILTLVLDALKGFGPAALFQSHFGGVDGGPAPALGLAAVALASLVGHQFSVFGRFRGGKGVATALGAYLAISPLACLAGLAVFIVVVRIWDFVSLGSMTAALLGPLLFWLLDGRGPIILSGGIMALLICFQHRQNIRRLIKGTESKWRQR